MSSTTTTVAASKKSKAKQHSRSSRAGLKFPVGRVARFIKNGKYASRIGAEAPVYMAAVLEYMAAEVLELAGDEVRRSGEKKTISPRHIMLAIMHDDELSKLLGGVVIPSSGAKFSIKQVLLPKK